MRSVPVWLMVFSGVIFSAATPTPSTLNHANRPAATAPGTGPASPHVAPYKSHRPHQTLAEGAVRVPTCAATRVAPVTHVVRHHSAAASPARASCPGGGPSGGSSAGTPSGDHFHRKQRRKVLHPREGDYSHSMVPGGLLVMSSTTRLTSATSLVMRVEMRSSTS